MTDVSCAGCGLVLPATGSRVSRPGVAASPECLMLYGEVIAFGMLHATTLGTWHQTSVDAYALQHVDPTTKPITICFALNGLHLVLERGWTGFEARQAHQRLADIVPHGEWPRFDPPSFLGNVTVLAPALAGTPRAQADAVALWGRSVWEAWRSVHDSVRKMTSHQLEGWRPLSCRKD